MPRTQKRKYEKVEDDEIDLVLQCTDSHEFYERYREAFPTKKKGIDSISKIWKRRGEFLKKRPELSQGAEPVTAEFAEVERALATQTRILEDLSVTMKEQLKVSREILTQLSHIPHTPQKTADPVPAKPETKAPEHREPVKRAGSEKPPSDIMIGS